MAEIKYAVVIAGKMPDDTSISFQLNFVEGTTPEEMNAEFDRLFSTIERRQNKLAADSVRHQIASKERALKDQGRSIVELKNKLDEEEAKNADRRVPANVQQLKVTYNNALNTYEGEKEALERMRAVLVELENKAA